MHWSRSNALAGALIFAILFGCGCGDDTAETEASSASPFSETAVRVRVAPAETGTLASRESVSAVVFADQSATLRAEVPGRVIRRVAVRGQPVQASDPLLELDDARLRLALQRAQAALQSNQADLSHATRELRRGIKLKERDTISEKHQDDLQNAVQRNTAQVALAEATRDGAERDLADATIRAPFDGIVEDWSVDVGDFVAAGAPVAEFVDLDRVRLRAGVTASHAARLAVGQETDAVFSALSGSRRTAILKSVGRVASAKTGTYEVELEVDNPEGDLREGMVAQVALPANASEARVLVPRTALLKTPIGMAVFIAAAAPDGGAHRAELRMVSIGPSSGDSVSILEGLSPGEQVVVEGQFALADGDAVVVDTTGAP